MPQPGSRAYDAQKHKLKKDLKNKGADADTAEEVADEGAQRMAESGDSTPQPTTLPPEADPAKNPPGQHPPKP